MKWFNCQTIEELKKQYRELIKKNHPDLGGNGENMKQINLEYETEFSRIKAGMDQKKASIYDVNDGYREVILKLLHIDGINIELCGSWLWISGDTKRNKEELKKAGCFWARKKLEWYWRPAEYKSSNRKSRSMDWIRNQYGSVMIEGEKEKRQQQESIPA